MLQAKEMSTCPGFSFFLSPTGESISGAKLMPKVQKSLVYFVLELFIFLINQFVSKISPGSLFKGPLPILTPLSRSVFCPPHTLSSLCLPTHPGFPTSRPRFGGIAGQRFGAGVW